MTLKLKLISLAALLFCSSLSAVAQLPDAPKPKPVADKKFYFVVSVLALATTADAVTTERAQTRGRGCIETNPFFGTHPSRGRLVAVNAASFSGEVLLAYTLKRFVRHKVWLAEPAFQIAQHIRFANQNEGLSCR